MSPRSPLWLALALVPTGWVSAQASAFEGAPGGPGNVVVFPAPGLAPLRPPELQGIVLLPIDATGRSAFTQFQADQPRRVTDVPLASRLLLPQQQGSLYRYRRAVTGGDEFGFLVVGPDGLARSLAAFPGTGGAGTTDPIPNPVAISPQGDALLVATTPGAGGDVFEVELGTGVVHPLTAHLAPLEILSQGLVLLPDWGAVLTSSGPLRFQRGGGSLARVALRPKAATAVLGHNPGAPVPPTLAHFGNTLVRSADGSTVAMVAGPSASQAHVFSFGPSGLSVCVNDAPAPIVSPSVNQAGPFLALSPNGRRAAWKTQEGASGECYSRAISALPSPPEFQITGDANFTDTLNDTGVIAFFDPDSVVVLVGEPNGVGGIENGDFYRATFGGGGGTPAFSNLTNTSGDGVAPFLEKGEIDTSDGIYQIPGQAGSVYFVSGSSGQGSIFRLDAASGTNALIRSGVAGLDLIERAGSYFVLGILHDSPFQRELVRVPFDHGQPATSFGLFPGSQTFASRAGSLAGAFGVLLNVTGGQRLMQIDVPSSTGTLFPGPYLFGSALGFDGNGALLSSVRSSATKTYFFSWSLDGVHSAQHGAGPSGSFVLPAN